MIQLNTLERIFYRGEIKIIEELLKENEISDIDSCMFGAGLGGHLEPINMITEHHKNNLIKENSLKYYEPSYSALIGACQGGHRELFDVLILMYPVEDIAAKDTDRGLLGVSNCYLEISCFGGNESIVDYFIDKGANNWNQGLNAACVSGNKKIIHKMIYLGANDWNLGLQGACMFGHKDIAELMVSMGASYHDCKGFAIRCGNQELVDYIVHLNLDPYFDKDDYDYDNYDGYEYLFHGRCDDNEFIEYDYDRGVKNLIQQLLGTDVCSVVYEYLGPTKLFLSDITSARWASSS